ncbi:hypothetical protein [Archangium sp.]|jgi:hypothetical protein|uniref:hypothetical protein n=1 Tax=Archangium sp. TaxID=1872627 RepID=UPI002ED9C34D
MKTLTKLIVPLLLGTLIACGDAVVVTVTPAATTVDQGAVVELTSTVTGNDNTAVTWAVEGGDANGTITPQGAYTAPSTPGTYSVVATSVADPTKKGSTLLIVRPLLVTVLPGEPLLHTTGSLIFSATVTGTTASTAVTWSVEGDAANGTITPEGVYTAPTTSGTYTVVATSVADPTKKATTQVKVGAVEVKVKSETMTLDQGASLALGVDVMGTSLQAVTWAVEGGDANGIVTSAGVYTAPHKPGTYTVVATSVADPSKKSSTTVTVNPVVVAIEQASPTLHTTGKMNLSATVTGIAGNKAVTWSIDANDATNSKGTITPEGVYTAPAAAGDFNVTATSVADPTKKATTTVKVTAIVVTPDPQKPTLDQGATVTLTANVTGLTGTASNAVTWAVTGGATNGTVTNAGVYTAPFRAGTYSVVATSVTDPSKKGTATITVRNVVVTLSPATLTLDSGATHAFTATVTGTTASTAVTWSVGGGAGRGTVTSDGVYTAPAAAGRFTVIATSAADPTSTGTATITVPTATKGFTYTDPPSTAPWRLVKNPALSTEARLVLDLVGPVDGFGRGVDLAITTDTRAPWAKLASGDSEYALNHAFDLGSGPQLFRSAVKATTLSVGVFQKGESAPAVALDRSLLTVAMDLTRLGPTVGKGPVAFNVAKAHVLSGSGALNTINVAVGTLTLE